MNLRSIKSRHQARGPHSPWVSVAAWGSDRRGMINRAKRRGEVPIALLPLEIGVVHGFRFITSPVLDEPVRRIAK